MMSERQVKKRAVKLLVGAELLRQARRLRINLAEELERRLRTMLRTERQTRWLKENREAIASINSFIEQHGLLAGRLRHRAGCARQAGEAC